MTLEEILDCSAEKLQAMTDEELLKHFTPYLDITRPERAAKRVTSQAISPDMQLKLKQLASLGIDVSLPMKRKKK
jgi:hypothetical protein